MNNRFTRLFTLFDQLKNELMGVLSFIEDFDRKSQMLEKGERNLGTRLKEIDQVREQLEVKSQEQVRNKEFIDRESARLAKLQVQLDYDKGEFANIKKRATVIDVREKELNKHEAALSEKIKSLEGLLQKEKELEEREALVTREKAIDRERKRTLDLRAKKIREREQQLQLDSEMSEL